MSISKDKLENTVILDIGCGPAKREGAWGIDIYQFKGVDQIVDLNEIPWDLPSDHFETVFATSIIEHVASIPSFMNEIHRISKDGAIVHIVTPHFSSIDSYTDPTHLWHLASGWHEIMTNSYLQSMVERYSHVQTKVELERNIFRFAIKFFIRIKGIRWWEKKLAFVFRGRDINTTLKVLKE